MSPKTLLIVVAGTGKQANIFHTQEKCEDAYNHVAIYQRTNQ
jgi:hypothetical protein